MRYQIQINFNAKNIKKAERLMRRTAKFLRMDKHDIIVFMTELGEDLPVQGSAIMDNS